MDRVFISYRRSDAEAMAARIADRLRQHFGDDEVFFDTDDIDSGVRWRERIDAALGRAELQLVIVGRGWLDARDAQGRRRLGAEGDVVTHEVGHALARGLPVIPVRVEGAALPAAAELPPALAHLFDFNDSEVRSGAAFERDVQALTKAMAKHLGGVAAWRRPARWAAGAAALAVLAGVAIWLPGRLNNGPAQATLPQNLPPTAAGPATPQAVAPNTLLLTLRLNQPPADALAPAAAPEPGPPPMRLYQQTPSRGSTPSVFLLEQAVALGDGALEYRSPLPLMPAPAQPYIGILHRFMPSGQHARRTAVCFIATAAPQRADDMVRLDCSEGQRCVVSAQDSGWARDCTTGETGETGPNAAPKASPAAAAHSRASLPAWPDWAGWPHWLAWPIGSAHAASPPTAPTAPAASAAPGTEPWAVPSLDTLRSTRYGQRAYSELRLQTGPLPAARGADRVLWSARINGTPLWVDGLPAEAAPVAFDAAKGLDLRLGLENLDAAGREAGFDALEITLQFMAGPRVQLQDRLQLRYVALRDIPAKTVRSAGDIAVQWQAKYHPGRQDDAYQVIIESSPSGDWLARRKRRIDAAGLSIPVGGQPLSLVAVQRPPYDKNPHHALNAGIRLPSGQLRFSFDEATARQVCHSLLQAARQQPGLLRPDAYRRTLDNQARVRRCDSL